MTAMGFAAMVESTIEADKMTVVFLEAASRALRAGCDPEEVAAQLDICAGQICRSIAKREELR